MSFTFIWLHLVQFHTEINFRPVLGKCELKMGWGGGISWLWHLDNKVPQEQAAIHHWNTLDSVLQFRVGRRGPGGSVEG